MSGFAVVTFGCMHRPLLPNHLLIFAFPRREKYRFFIRSSVSDIFRRFTVLKKMIFAATMSVISLYPAVSHADWLMVGPYQFTPRLSSAQYGVYNTGARIDSGGAGYMTATLSIPLGRTVTGMWCQVYDNSSNNINVNLAEVNTDANGSGAQRAILALNSSGTPGHTQYATTTTLGSAVIKSFDNSAPGGAQRFYSYTLNAYMDGTASTGIKGCAIQYI
jgi:hypothetical protein